MSKFPPFKEIFQPNKAELEKIKKEHKIKVDECVATINEAIDFPFTLTIIETKTERLRGTRSAAQTIIKITPKERRVKNTAENDKQRDAIADYMRDYLLPFIDNYFLKVTDTNNDYCTEAERVYEKETNSYNKYNFLIKTRPCDIR